MSAFRYGKHFLFLKVCKTIKILYFCTTIKEDTSSGIEKDPVVQLVRMPPCHGGGRGFESRPDRNYNIKVVQKALKRMF